MIILVYNGPPLSVEILKEIRKIHSKVVLIKFRQKLGPAFAYVIGMKYAMDQADVIVFTDADALLL